MIAGLRESVDEERCCWAKRAAEQRSEGSERVRMYAKRSELCSTSCDCGEAVGNRLA